MKLFKNPVTITIISLLFLLFLVTPLIASAVSLGGGIGIMPGTQDANDPRTKSWFIYTMNPGETKEDSVNLINNSDDEVVVKVYPVDATTTTDGNFTLIDEFAEQLDVGSWIELFAYEVGLKPQEVKKVPFTIKVPDNADVGDHMGGLIVQEVSRGSAGGSSEGMSMSVVTRVGARIYLTVPGEKIEKLNIEDFSHLFFSKTAGFLRTFFRLNYNTRFVVSLSNEGNVRINPDVKIKIKNIFGMTMDEIGGELGVVFPKKTSNINLIWEKNLFFGRYTAEAIVKFSDSEDPVTQKIIFWAIPYKVLTFLGGLIVIIILLRLILLYFRELSKEKMLIYILPKQETIQDIAEKFKVNWSKLARINNIKKPYALKKGQKLFIPTNRRNRELLKVLLKKDIVSPSIQEKLGKSKKSILEKIHQGKKSLKILMIAIIIIIIGGGLTLIFYVKSKKQDLISTSVQILPPGEGADENRTKTGELKRSEINLAVHNSSSSSENVDKLLKKLDFVGFQVEETSYRSLSNYEKTTFEYQTDKLEYAKTVQTSLEIKEEDIEFIEVEDLEYDVVIVYFIGDIFDLEIPELTDQDLMLVDSEGDNQETDQESEVVITNSEVEVDILNGGAPAGTAGQVADQLIQSGFTQTTAANADNFDYQGITIRHKGGFSSTASEIKDILSGDYSNISLEENNAISSDIQIILGT